MKVLIINTYDRGGAGIACLRLHKGLLCESVDVSVLLLEQEKSIPGVYQFQKEKVTYNIFQKIWHKLNERIKQIKRSPALSSEQSFLISRSKDLELFSFPNSNYDITTSPLYKEANIINLHWVAGFLDYKSFFKKNTKPIVWTLHDMNPFTGGEHFKETYLGINNLGFPITRQVSNEEIIVANKNIKIKRQALSKVRKLTIITPSEWLAEEARKSKVFKNYPVFCIPNGINSNIFKPRGQAYAKATLNIPSDKKVILYVAEYISNSRKGFGYLKKAFAKLGREDVVLCSIGIGKSDLGSVLNIIELGSINTEELMSIAYSAADVFVIPSLMDNLPNTVLESLMCGTPVIGFPVGGIVDMIQDGENGYLAEEISVDSLTFQLNKFLDNSDIFNRNEIRNNAMKKYDKKIQAKQYIDLFNQILKKDV
ncbi:glycosyltransferase [Seonamhaeicola maritimus]|uniref:glycosyltransferase n=1 Tax=Seonamhaeicola maritimus TaxID=2591822 RepID=UPI002495783A|nr:glycosyltransferase [Seonamhaeicola maritimus]